MGGPRCAMGGHCIPKNIHSLIIARFIFTYRRLELILEFSWQRTKTLWEDRQSIVEANSDRQSLTHIRTY